MMTRKEAEAQARREWDEASPDARADILAALDWNTGGKSIVAICLAPGRPLGYINKRTRQILEAAGGTRRYNRRLQ
jgi:hypothetical protein